MLVIRPLVIGDKSDWLRLWAGYQAFYRVQIPANTSELVWRRLLDRSEPMFGALAVDGERAVGLVHRIRHRTCWTTGDYCYLQDLFVEAGQRGKGVGRKLIEHVYHEAEQEGCSRVYWLTHETNAEAMQLYDKVAERSGFVQYRKAMPHATAVVDPGT